MQPKFEYLGPYRVESILGRGGMGTVYKGVHHRTGEIVAIKVIAPSIADQPRFRRRFAAEVEVLKRLRHPNIVGLLGYGEEHGLLFYTMEYVDGSSLEQHLRAHGKIPWEDVLEVGIQVASALKHAHDLGVIHRDLKPANLLVAKGGIIKLTDFGIAKLFGASDMTVAGSVIGTADYMPPEQAEGKPVTVRSDLYALGCVMYALLTGKPPFSASSIPEVLYAVRYKTVPDLRERAPETPDGLCELIHQLLEKDASQRPPTALLVRNRLMALQHALRDTETDSARKETPASAETGKTADVGRELTSLDLSELDEDDFRLTESASSVGSNDDADAAAVPTGELEGEAALTATTDSSVRRAGGGAAGSSSASGDEATINGNVSSEPVDDFTVDASVPVYESEEAGQANTVVTGAGASQYHAIEEEETEFKSILWGDTELEDQGSERDWGQIVSVVFILALLIGAIVIVVKAMQPPTADQLYREIMVAVDSGDESKLAAVRDEISEFLARFPDDSRAEELELIYNDLELDRVTRVLQRRAARSGQESLTAIEQAFLQCMLARQRDDPEADQKLVAFLDVFGKVENLSRNEQRYVDLARHALENDAVPDVESESEAAARELEDLIRSAEQSLAPQELKSFYRDILTLYSDKPWAQPHIQRIRKILDSES